MSSDGQSPLPEFTPTTSLVEPDANTLQAANATFAMFVGYVRAGFTEAQALHLVTAVLTAHLRKPGSAE